MKIHGYVLITIDQYWLSAIGNELEYYRRKPLQRHNQRCPKCT